ncbi:uncharacterized protein LOC142167383 [Nicotiana tabacum]|uniref:Uncharacterized protein LOC142167383 n=1 Tax=Nicotiana tabacum TaxID=4097 RepID=A0AC58SF96_TOBAC
MILKPWTVKFDFTKEFLQEIPMWVVLPNLPMSCWGEFYEVCLKIGHCCKQKEVENQAYMQLRRRRRQRENSQPAHTDGGPPKQEWRTKAAGDKIDKAAEETGQRQMSLLIMEDQMNIKEPDKENIRVEEQEHKSPEISCPREFLALAASIQRKAVNDRIWLTWDPNVYRVNVERVEAQIIHYLVKGRLDGFESYLTLVYGFNTVDQRKELWTSLADISTQINKPWLIGLPWKGDYYTWTNNQQGAERIVSRIDRIFGNDSWMMNWGHVHTQYDTLIINDHSPMLVNIETVKLNIKTPFRFFNVWSSHDEFDTIVGTLWRRKEADDQMENIWKKLKALKSLFKSLNTTEYKGIAKGINNARADLIQKDRVKWIKLGDANTKYFSAVMKERSQRKQILEIYTEDRVKLATHTSVKEEIVNFYKSLMRTVVLYKAINYTAIILIPKVTNPTTTRDFRPIACCSVLYKIISKVLENRIQKVIPNIISEAQAGFIPGRKIADNIILAHELVKAYTRKNTSPRCIIKIDLTKAYDSVGWIFLEHVMVELGFLRIFQDWVITCVKTVSYSIVVNGEPIVLFPTAKELRQGDRISSFLFAIVMEYLSRGLKGLQKEKEYKYIPRCSKLGITHLNFADDLLLFTRGDITYITQLQQCLNQFYRASGLQANKTKSSIYYGGVTQAVQDKMQLRFGYTIGELLIKYLEVSLSTKKMSLAQWQPLIEKMVARVSSWTTKKLSYAGRIQLVQSVLFGIQAYWSQLFLIPRKVLKTIEAYCRSYVWSGSNVITRRSLVAWEKMCTPKSAGRLHLINPKLWNKGVAAKNH